ncbi:DNA-directed DNA polymerase II small subunit [Halovivax cerinus]|uniref:DNA polymerase II small subunit n=1 Tax=Halovivax cerinus TaxID=1487865 RepID=A0ABD5NRP6_9EURY|nr:DNA-directed DNA polymerase II small subunit [Halovivax cerinus]
MPLEGPARIVQTLTARGFNADREAVTLLAAQPDPAAALEQVLEDVPDETLVISAESVRQIVETTDTQTGDSTSLTATDDRVNQSDRKPRSARTQDSSNPVSDDRESHDPSISTPDVDRTGTDDRDHGADEPAGFERSGDVDERDVRIRGDMTGESTGTGAYRDFVSIFRDRLDRLQSKLSGRVNHRPASSIEGMPGGSDVAMIGLVNDVRSTASGHWLVELEDTTGTFPFLVMKDREYVDLVDELLRDEVIAMEGTLADDSGIAFVDSMYFPDVPRTREASTADRHVEAALISDVHVGSEEFMADAWNRFADWLHGEDAQHVEYLCIAGDMVEGVGVYPNQDEELDIVDIYEQYEAFNEFLKRVPGDLDIVMIPGNHDAVRLAEPQPGFDEHLRSIMSAHDPQIVSNPSTVELEGVSILMYHGVSLDEVIAELPAEKASYDEPHKAMYQLLKKRHVAPQFGGHTRLAPEERDYLVIDDVPDIFHTGHVHKLGFGKYHDVLAINSGCWQSQTDFQKSVNIDPDAGYAPIVDLQTLDVTVQKFS